MRNESKITIRNKKYDTPDYPSWLCETGRALFDKSLSFRVNCLQYGNDPAWRRRLNREAERLANAE